MRAWRRVLARLPIRLQCYQRAVPALEAVIAESPALVVSDHQMPGMSGLDLLACIREARPTVDVLLFTADAAARESASRHGFRVVDKAAPPGDLRNVVESLIAAWSARSSE